MKPQIVFRVLLGLAAVVLAGSAVYQLADPLGWYWAVPGVPLTGPFNPHFVRDIGAAYLAAVLGFVWFAWRPRQGWPALVAGSVFLTLHAAIHVHDEACSADPLAALKRDFVGIHLFALLAVVAAIACRPAKEV
jgi:hypothetical protein